MMITLSLSLGWDYVKQLVDNRPVIIRDRRLGTEWIARGKYAMGVIGGTGIVEKFKEMGMPIDTIPPVPEARFLTDGGASIVLFTDPPHPKARQVFLNWLLTQEGSTAWSRADLKQSARIDTPTDHLSPYELREEGRVYVNALTLEWYQAQEEKIGKISEIFRPLLK